MPNIVVDDSWSTSSVSESHTPFELTSSSLDSANSVSESHTPFELPASPLDPDSSVSESHTPFELSSSPLDPEGGGEMAGEIFHMESIMDTAAEFGITDTEAFYNSCRERERERERERANAHFWPNQEAILVDLCRQFGVDCLMKECDFVRDLYAGPRAGMDIAALLVVVHAEVDGYLITYSCEAVSFIDRTTCPRLAWIKVESIAPAAVYVDSDGSYDECFEHAIMTANIIFGRDTLIPSFLIKLMHLTDNL